MKKKSIQRSKLDFAKETIRHLVPAELTNVAGGLSCSAPTATACGCSGSGGCYTDTDDTLYCTHTAV